jgi:hypothetical protein
MKEKIHLFDKVGDKYEFYYNENKDSYYVLDKYDNKKNDLAIKYRKYSKYKNISEIEEIRFWFPKPHNFDRDFYKKPVHKIKFELFGVFDSKSGSQLKLTIDDCKKIIKNKYDELGYLMSYTDMIQSNQPILKKAYTFIGQNGGSKKYNELAKELGLDLEFYYKDDKGIFLKSSFEFIFFSILHFNNIKYEYEPFKVKTYVPDFYIPKSNYLIEILGLYGRDYYFKRTIDKEKLYITEGYNYKPIIVDRHRPKESIFKGCEIIFGNLKLPNFIEYNKKYIQTSKEFIEQLKIYLEQINNGKLKVSIRKNKSGFSEKYRHYYNYVLENYETIQIAIKELIGIPSTKFKSQKIENYWMNKGYVRDELENVFKNEKRIPSQNECYKKFRQTYNIWNFYRFWGEKALKKGGEFYEFVEELKFKYGYRDIVLENKIEKEKEQIEFQKEVHKVVMLVYNGKLLINGTVSLFTKYRPIYSYLFKNYGGVFYYIKEKVGYPPSHILRPKGYYHNKQNVKYELEENWKTFKRILTYSERINDMGKTNTYYNIIASVGIKEFKKGGKYYSFIESLKKKYGYDDSIEKSEIELQKNLVIYLKGINDGKWNTKAKTSKVLGSHSVYYNYVRNHYKYFYIAINTLIGFPSPKVVRYPKYYNNVENCRNEIKNIINIYGYLPMHSDLNHKNIPHKQILKTIYAKYKVKEFEKGGLFYNFIQKLLKTIINSKD